MPGWDAWAGFALWAALFGAYAGIFWWLDRRDRQRRRAVVDEIKLRPRLILWITEDGVISTAFDGAAATADYLERCVKTLRDQES